VGPPWAQWRMWWAWQKRPWQPRETAAAVPMEQRSPQRRRDRPRLGADLEDSTLGIMLHDHPARVASKALRRFCRNASAIFDDGLAGLIGIFQDGGVHMHHDLVVLGRRARIDAVVQRGFGQQLQGVGLLLMGCTPSVRQRN
jgi:hypothetical protein